MRVGVMQRISECDALFFRLEQNPTAVRIPGTACSYKHESSKHWHMRKLPFRAGAVQTAFVFALQHDATGLKAGAPGSGQRTPLQTVAIKGLCRVAGQRYARVAAAAWAEHLNLSLCRPRRRSDGGAARQATA